MLVSSDVWCEETPATVFPSATSEGDMDLRVFLQDEVWVNNLGVVFPLEELSAEYLQEIMRYCFDNAEMLQDNILEWFGVRMMLAQEGLLSPSPHQLERFASEALATVEMSPVAWVNETAFMKKVVGLLTTDTAV